VISVDCIASECLVGECPASVEDAVIGPVVRDGVCRRLGHLRADALKVDLASSALSSLQIEILAQVVEMNTRRRSLEEVDAPSAQVSK
jgi:hypothetical protein